MRRRGAVLLWLVIAAACGAKTALRVPYDAGRGAPPGIPCRVGQFPLVRRDTEVALVVDRSGSMSLDFAGERAVAPFRRWDALRESLAATVPALDGEVRFGLLAFPAASAPADRCGLDAGEWIEPARSGAASVLGVLGATEPRGPTPTADALILVGDRLAPRVSASRAACIVLATDGGPNCNDVLDPTTCTCTGGAALDCEGSPVTCLDDDRTVSTIRGIAERGVPTYVIGLDASFADFERDALERMAAAGGRARSAPGARGYYSAADAEDLAAALAAVQASIACVRATPSRPDDPDAIVVELGGAAIARDPSHREGWDWAPFELGQIEFHGAACARLRAGESAVGVRVDACADR